MMSKSLAAVLGAATVVGVAVVGARQVSGTSGPARTTDRTVQSSAHDFSTDANPNAGNPGASQSRMVVPGKPLPERDEVRHNAGNGGHAFGPDKTKSHGHRQDRAKNGSYITVIAGFYSGSGTADVRDDKVSIKAELVAEDGRSGAFIANNLTFDGPYFSGVATIFGEPVQVNGRVDAARASRLTATINGPDGHAGRVVGNLPAALDAGDDNWDGDDQSGRSPK